MRRQIFISQHGEIIPATVIAVDFTSDPDNAPNPQTIVKFEFLVRHEDGTFVSGRDNIKVSKSQMKRYIHKGDQIALIYFNDDFYRVL